MEKLTKITSPTNLTHVKKTNEVVDKVNSLIDNAITDTERNKLKGIEDGANKTIVDSALSSTSTNPLENKAVNAALNNKVTKNNNSDANGLLNSLSTGTSVPSDNDYYISQYAQGGTTTTTYHRRPVSKLAEYVKGKLATVATSGSYDDLTNKPAIPTIPGAVKNPYSLSFTGGSTEKYDGSAAKTVNIPIVDSALSSTSTNAIQNKVVNTELNKKAAKATTLAGYGITDAKIESGKITLGSNTITPLTSHQSLAVYAKTTDVEAKISNAVTELKNGLVEVVTELPATGTTGKIYFVPNGETSGDNVYTEYAYINGKFEVLGNLKIDLSQYTKKSELATVATSGSYSDLTNKPTIPKAVTVDSSLSTTSTNPVQNKVVVSGLSEKAAKSDVKFYVGTAPDDAPEGSILLDPEEITAFDINNLASKVQTVNHVGPDSNGNISINTDTVKSVNNTIPNNEGNIGINVGVKTINNVLPTSTGNLDLPGYLKRNTAYKVGDIVYSTQLPGGYYLECVTAGVTGAVEPVINIDGLTTVTYTDQVPGEETTLYAGKWTNGSEVTITVPKNVNILAFRLDSKEEDKYIAVDAGATYTLTIGASSKSRTITKKGSSTALLTTSVIDGEVFNVLYSKIINTQSPDAYLNGGAVKK